MKYLPIPLLIFSPALDDLRVTESPPQKRYYSSYIYGIAEAMGLPEFLKFTGNATGEMTNINEPSNYSPKKPGDNYYHCEKILLSLRPVRPASAVGGLSGGHRSPGSTPRGTTGRPEPMLGPSRLPVFGSDRLRQPKIERIWES